MGYEHIPGAVSGAPVAAYLSPLGGGGSAGRSGRNSRAAPTLPRTGRQISEGGGWRTTWSRHRVGLWCMLRTILLLYHFYALTSMPFFVKGSKSSLLAVFTDGVPNGDGDLPVVAGEDPLHPLPLGGPGDQAHHRHDDQSRQHAEGAGVDGGLKDGREVGAEEDVGQHDHGGEEEAGPAGGGGGPLPVQAEEEGGQEGAGQGAPAHAHELGDEGDVGA